MSDPDPVSPFILFIHAGFRRIGEIGHYVKLFSKHRVRCTSASREHRPKEMRLRPKHLVHASVCMAETTCVATRQGSPAGPEVSRKGPDRVKRRQARASSNHRLLALSSRPRLPPYLPFVASRAWTAQTQRVASSSKSPRGLTIPAIFIGFRLSLGQPSRTSTVVVCCFI